MVRLFIIQHDCGHAAFFPSPRANDRLGRLLGVLTLTPYAFWRQEHAVHHATSGNLDRRGIGDVTTLTVDEYRSRSALARLTYRLYRHPLVLFGLGPSFHFLIRHRVPTGNPRRHRHAWLSVLGTNAALAGIGLVMGLTIGLQPFLLAYIPAAIMAASIGVWLFYVQHQFEDTYWQPAARWRFATAALEGSSFYDLPRPLHWATGHIGFHHIHHLCSRIPNYRLAECCARNPELQRFAKRLTLRESLGCARLALWDPEKGRLVSFRQARSPRGETEPSEAG
jgi:omega-6 fatty acid desaturase (delta-12 desaturase)